MTIIVGTVIGIIWLVICCRLTGKIRIKSTKVTLTVIAVILFILSVADFAGTRIGAVIGSQALEKSGALLDEYLKTNHGNVQLVRSGVPVSDVSEAINDLEALLPRKISEAGLSGIILESLYKTALTKGFNIIRAKTDLIVSYAEDGKVTSSTIITALKSEINALMQRIVFYCTIVTAGILAMYFFICLVFASKKPKMVNSSGGGM